jgi:Alginate lyase/Secretion system C-terminal sorting domain
MKKQILILTILLLSLKLVALNPQLPPGSNFDLDSWILQTISTGNLFEEKLPPDLRSGFTNSLFYTNTVDGSLVFRVPSNGGTTSGSGYPRVEFRQVKNAAYWIMTDTAEHYLTAQCKVMVVAAAKPQTIIGQIHGNETNSELLKLRWTGYLAGKCYVEARYQTNDAARTEYGVKLATGLSLGDMLTYTITMKKGTIVATVNGTSATQSYTTEFYGTTDSYYFKAGNYLQYSSTDANIYGLNQFYKLSLLKQEPTELMKVKSGFLKIFPNPAKDNIVINSYLSTSANLNFQILDCSGKLIKSMNSIGDQSIDVSDLSTGIYLVKLNSQSFSTSTKLLIIKQSQ